MSKSGSTVDSYREDEPYKANKNKLNRSNDNDHYERKKGTKHSNDTCQINESNDMQKPLDSLLD